MLDLLTGDKVFDAAYIVEAAPKDVVRELLSITIRDLIRTMPSEVRAGTIAPGVFVLVAACQLTAIQIEAVIHAGVAIAAAAPDAFARANMLARGGGPYRGGPLPDTVKAQREQDLAAIKKVQRKRFWKEFFRSVAAMFGGEGFS